MKHPINLNFIKKIDSSIAENRQKISEFFNYNLMKSRKNHDNLHPRIRLRYIPFLYPHDSLGNDTEQECLENSSDDFPNDLFSMNAKRNGAIVFHFIFAIYCFMLLAVVCNDYFLPAVELICDKLNLSQVSSSFFIFFIVYLKVRHF